MSRRLTNSLAAVAVLALAGLLATKANAQYPDPERRILQASARLVGGFGFARGTPDSGFMGTQGARADLLWGKPGDEHFRFGPALDIRTACTLPLYVLCLHNQTIEAGVGGTVLIPFRRGYPITITPVIGYALRTYAFGGNGMYLSNTFAWGYRPYNYFHRYGYGIQAFAQHRMHLDDPSQWDMTFGIEFDLELAVWVPMLMVRMALMNDDPDEPYTNGSDPAVRDVGGASTGTGPEPSSSPAPSEGQSEGPAEGN